MALSLVPSWVSPPGKQRIPFSWATGWGMRRPTAPADVGPVVASSYLEQRKGGISSFPPTVPYPGTSLGGRARKPLAEPFHGCPGSAGDVEETPGSPEPGESQGCPRPVRRAGTRWGWHHAAGRRKGRRKGSAGARAGLCCCCPGSSGGSGGGGLTGWAERGCRERLGGGMGQGCGR